jgi:hypothetical protein
MLLLRGVLTLLAYLLSSLLHAGGDIVLSETFISTVSWPFFSMLFCFSQAVVIALEDVLIQIARQLGVKDGACAWTRALGFVWVALWSGWCVPGFVENMIRAGGGIRKSTSRVGGNDMGPNLVQAVMVGLFGFDIGQFAKSWFGT